MKIVIIIPTYNERENTLKMIDSLSGIINQTGKHHTEVLYVDANSPDGTAEIIKNKQKEYSWLKLLVEDKKEGLGMAYAKGMKFAMEKLNADYLVEFDADFQHRPEDIPKLIAQIDNGGDYIIGSRYIKGGSIPKEWELDRKLLSKIGNLVARILLILPHIHDVTGGFKLSRVKGFMDSFDFNTLLSRSFAYKIHLLFYMVQKGARVKEVPVKFQLRASGDSKIIKNELQETLKVIFLLQSRNPRTIRLFRFATVGFFGYLINALFLKIFTELQLSGLIVWGGSTEMAIVSNFTLNNLWTFKADQIKGIKDLVFKFLQFNLTSIGGLLIQTTTGLISDSLLKSDSYRQIVLPITIVLLILPYNYLIYTRVIWKTKGKGSNQK